MSLCPQELLRWLEDRQSPAGDRLHALLCRCLEAGPWRQHAQRLLQVLPAQDLLLFSIDLLGGSPFPSGSSSPSSIVNGASLVFRGVQWPSLDQLTLAAALGCCLPRLLRLLRDDEWQDERQQVEQRVRQLLLPAEGQPAAAVVAVHWRLRRQLAQQRASAAGQVELHEALLLHLFAAAFLVQQLSTSSRAADAEQVQGLLASSGFPCQLAAAQSPASHPRRSSSDKGKHRKKRRRRSKHGGSSKKRRKERQRSPSSGDESGSSGSSDGDDDGFFGLAHFAMPSDEAPQRLWHLGQPGDRPAPVSSLELLDAVIAATGAASARWLFARS